MSAITLYVAITNHGFGHVTRTASVLAALKRRYPAIQLILVTLAPRWLLESYLTSDFIYRPRQLDIGVIQSDSLTMDLPATLKALRQIRKTAAETIAEEATFIQDQGIQLVLADIPPLAVPIAKAAGVPCWMMSNFGWDLIYGQWGDAFAEEVDWIQSCFAHCDRLFRLPFHAPMSVFPNREDVGLTGGSPRHDPDTLRQDLRIQVPSEKIVLLTFGGLGLSTIPYANVQHFPDWLFLTLDRDAPNRWPNLIRLDGQTYRPVDLMSVCGVVISKPGYGTFSEACRLNIPLITVPRRDFAEAQYLIEGIQHYNHHQILEPGEFTQSAWEFLHRPCHPPRSPQRVPIDGNELIVQAMGQFFSVKEI
jgi:hypothetical protein